MTWSRLVPARKIDHTHALTPVHETQFSCRIQTLRTKENFVPCLCFVRAVQILISLPQLIKINVLDANGASNAKE